MVVAGGDSGLCRTWDGEFALSLEESRVGLDEFASLLAVNGELPELLLSLILTSTSRTL